VTTDECIALSDDELVHAAYEAVDVFDVDDVLDAIDERRRPQAARHGTSARPRR
jgi:hypothetical protein